MEDGRSARRAEGEEREKARLQRIASSMVKIGPSVLVSEELGGLWGSGSLIFCP